MNDKAHNVLTALLYAGPVVAVLLLGVDAAFGLRSNRSLLAGAAIVFVATLAYTFCRELLYFSGARGRSDRSADGSDSEIGSGHRGGARRARTT